MSDFTYIYQNKYLYSTLVMADQLADRTIKPLYLKDFDLQCIDANRVTDFMLMERVIDVIGNYSHCLQLDGVYM